MGRAKRRTIATFLSMMFCAFMASGSPLLLGWAIDNYRAVYFKHGNGDKVIGLQEYTARAVPNGDSIDIEYTWDRCGKYYILVDKHFELVKLDGNGRGSFRGKTKVEDIDFNKGCVGFTTTIPRENWLELKELDDGKYELIMQLQLEFVDGTTRPHDVRARFTYTK